MESSSNRYTGTELIITEIFHTYQNSKDVISNNNPSSKYAKSENNILEFQLKLNQYITRTTSVINSI